LSIVLRNTLLRVQSLLNKALLIVQYFKFYFSFLILFYTISFDFILILLNKQNIDVILIAIYIFFKKVIIIINKNIYIAKN